HLTYAGTINRRLTVDSASVVMRKTSGQPDARVRHAASSQVTGSALSCERRVRGRVEQPVHGRGVGRLDLDEPTRPVRVGIDQLGLPVELFVRGRQGARHGGVDLRDALGRLALAERLPRLDRDTRVRQGDEHDVTERILSKVRYADPDAVRP